MKIEREIPCSVDIDALDAAEIVANSDVKEQAIFFEHLAYQLTSYRDMDKDTKLSHIVEEIFYNTDEDEIRKFLEQMLGWFDYYEKEFNEE